MRHRPLPDSLGESFGVADAYDRGVTRGRLRSGDLARPFHAVRARADRCEPASLDARVIERASDYAHRMTEHEFFSHETAALLWGMPLPYDAIASMRLEVSVLLPRRSPSARGVRGHALEPRTTRVVTPVGGAVRLTSPATTWVLLAVHVSNIEDLVVAGDAAIRVPMHPRDPPALTTRDQLEAALCAGKRVGARRLREALPLLNERSRSRQETRLRLRLADAGIPAPAANFDVFEAGLWLAQVDLAYPEWKVAAEYEGEHHLLDRDQWNRDIARYERLVAAGWRVIRVTKDQLERQPGAVIDRVRQALGGL